MIRRVVTIWMFVLGLMVVLTGPNVLVANMAGHMTGGYLAAADLSPMHQLSEGQMAQLVGGQGCFGFGPSCCDLIEGVMIVSSLLSGFSTGFFPLIHISSSSYRAFCV